MSDPVQSLNDNFFYNSMLARALLQILPASDRPPFRMWLNKLHEMDSSSSQMNIRNDYMWFILLMLQNKRIAEPFKKPPPQGELQPLKQTLPAEVYEDILTSTEQTTSWMEQPGYNLDITELEKMQDPMCSPPAKFLENQPVPRDGIICYMAAFSDHDF